jgi:hypothetical protein
MMLIGTLQTLPLAAANYLRSAEDRHTSVKLAEHQVAIAELRRLDQGYRRPAERAATVPAELTDVGIPN